MSDKIEFEAIATQVAGEHWPYNEVTLKAIHGTFDERMEGERYHVTMTPIEPLVAETSDKIELDVEFIEAVNGFPIVIADFPNDIKLGRYHAVLTPAEPEVKACPFCGGDALLDYSRGEYQVRCMGCSTGYTPWARSKDEVIAAWNRRTP